MGTLLFFGFVIIVVVLLANSSSGKAQSVYKKLMSSGLQARGILLKVNKLGQRQAGGMRSGSIKLPLVRFERRDVLIDVELPGEAPYEVQTSILIPMNLSRDVLPGATVELRVDPRARGNIAIVGPGIGLPVATSLSTGKQ